MAVRQLRQVESLEQDTPEQETPDEPQVMRVTFRGEDLGIFTDRRMTVSETILLKQRTGLTTKEFLEGIGDIDGHALQALVWLLKFRKHEAINPKELDFELGELRLEREPDPTRPTSESDGSAT